jgi:excisionase family DNA binding protein
MESISDRIISAPVGEFCVLSGLGRTVVYEMIGDGRLESIKIGKRRLILLDSYRRLIENQLSAPTQGQTAEGASSLRANEERRAVDIRRQRRLTGSTRAS